VPTDMPTDVASDGPAEPAPEEKDAHS
jgi:hypothetical protein